MKNILCVIDSLGSGGAQRQLVELAKGFKEKGHKVSFLIYHDDNFFGSDLKQAGIEVALIIEPNPFKRVLKIRKFIRNAHVDAVISFLESPNVLCQLAGFPFRKWKLILGERSADPNILKSVKRKFLRKLYFFSDYVVGNSYHNIEMVRQINPLLNTNKLKVVYNVIDESIWNADLVTNSGEDKKEEISLVVAASHQYLKNAKGLVEAVNLLPTDAKNKLRVAWYGGTRNDNSLEEAKELVEKYKLHDSISFFPPTDKIPVIFAEADIIGLFSFFEGLPNVVCEGMMLGKPVISSNVSDVPKLLEENFIFDPNNVEDIKQTLLRVVAMEPSRLIEEGKKNRKKARRLFNKEMIIDSYLKLLQ